MSYSEPERGNRGCLKCGQLEGHNPDCPMLPKALQLREQLTVERDKVKRRDLLLRTWQDNYEQLRQQLAVEQELSKELSEECEHFCEIIKKLRQQLAAERENVQQVYDWLKLASKNATNDAHLAAATEAVLSIIGEQK